MVDPELTSSSEFEGVVSKIELAVRNREPLDFNRDDAKFLRRTFEDAGVRFLISNEGKSRLIGASMLRIKVVFDDAGEVFGVAIYDYEKPEGQRWTNFQDIYTLNLGSEKFVEDKALGLFEMLRLEKLGELAKWCYEQAKEAEYPGKIGGFEGTEGRGLIQVAADLLGTAYSWESQEMVEILTSRLNRRLWKGYKKTLEEVELTEVDKKFSEAGVEEPVKTLASIPPQVLPNLVRFLATKPQA